MSDELLMPIIKFARGRYGFIAKLVAAVQARTSIKVYRQVMERWLHPERNRRTPPALGIGLVIAEEGKNLMVQWPTGQTDTDKAPRKANKCCNPNRRLRK